MEGKEGQDGIICMLENCGVVDEPSRFLGLCPVDYQMGRPRVSEVTSVRDPEYLIWSESGTDLNCCSVTHMVRDGVADA